MPSIIDRPDFTLGHRPARVGISSAPWAPKLLEDLLVPSAGDVQRSAYDATQAPLDVAGPTTPAGQTMRGRRGEAYDKPYPAPRTKMLPNPSRDDPYASDGDKKYAALHDIEHRDYSGMDAEMASAVFTGSNVPRAPFQRQEPSYTGNLDELIDTLTESIRAGEYSHGAGLLAEEEDVDFDTQVKRVAEAIVAVMEDYGGVSIEDVLTSMHAASTSGVSLVDCLKLAQQWSREGRTNAVSEVVSNMASKISQGLHGEDRTRKPKKTNGISNSKVAHDLVAVAASGTKRKKTGNISGSVAPRVNEEQMARLDHLNRLLRG